MVCLVSDSERLENAMVVKAMRQHKTEQGLVMTCVKCKEGKVREENGRQGRDTSQFGVGWKGTLKEVMLTLRLKG